MRLAPFALFALVGLPACAPYGPGYGYGGGYGGPVYGSPGYSAPYYSPGYGAPPAEGVVLFDSDGRRRDDRREYRRGEDRPDLRQRPGQAQVQAQRPQPRPVAQPRPEPQRPAGPPPNNRHAPDFNPADPGSTR